MEAAKEDVRSDISVLKRAAEKAETEVMKAQREKKRQVWYKGICHYVLCYQQKQSLRVLL